MIACVYQRNCPAGAFPPPFPLPHSPGTHGRPPSPPPALQEHPHPGTGGRRLLVLVGLELQLGRHARRGGPVHHVASGAVDQDPIPGQQPRAKALVRLSRYLVNNLGLRPWCV